MIVTTRCPHCKKAGCVTGVNSKGYVAWQNGALIQNALPELSADERERLVTGVCPRCWTEYYTIGEDDA